jgi:hypothetical protein
MTNLYSTYAYYFYGFYYAAGSARGRVVTPSD